MIAVSKVCRRSLGILSDNVKNLSQIWAVAPGAGRKPRGIIRLRIRPVFTKAAFGSDICPLTSGRDLPPEIEIQASKPHSERLRGESAEHMTVEGLVAVSAIDVSVVIPTFRRPELLRAAVGSVLEQRGLAVGVEIVVIDNDPARSAERIVADLAGSPAMVLRYLASPGPVSLMHAMPVSRPPAGPISPFSMTTRPRRLCGWRASSRPCAILRRISSSARCGLAFPPAWPSPAMPGESTSEMQGRRPGSRSSGPASEMLCCAVTAALPRRCPSIRGSASPAARTRSFWRVSGSGEGESSGVRRRQ